MLERDLEKLGLSPKESRVYLATLELGQDTVQNIAKKAKIRRPTTYVILDSLLKMGLVTTVEEGKKTLYAAEAPEQLDILLKKQEDYIEDQRSRLKGIIPDLRAVYNLSTEKPTVKFYEGKEGIIAMQEDFLRQAKAGIEEDVVGFTPLDELFRIIPDYEETFTQKRKDKSITNRVIYTSKEGPRADASDPKEKRMARFVPQEKFPFQSSYTAYADRLAITSYGKRLMGVMIENKEISQAFKSFFELAWESAQKYNK